MLIDIHLYSCGTSRAIQNDYNWRPISRLTTDKHYTSIVKCFNSRAWMSLWPRDGLLKLDKRRLRESAPRQFIDNGNILTLRWEVLPPMKQRKMALKERNRKEYVKEMLRNITSAVLAIPVKTINILTHACFSSWGWFVPQACRSSNGSRWRKWWKSIRINGSLTLFTHK